MEQKIADAPKTKQEYERQKGPIPTVAVLLVLGLIAAALLFFVPAITSSSQQ